jgi:gluconokinase
MPEVLALDVGSSSVRAQRFDDRADPVDELKQERYEGQDPDEIVALVRKVVDGRDGDAAAAGISCFGHSLLALDRDDKPLTEILGWRDTRSTSAAEWLRHRLDPEAVHARTGGFLHPSFWPAKLAWLAQERPDVFRAATSFVSFPDYLNARLFGGELRTTLSMPRAPGCSTSPRAGGTTSCSTRSGSIERSCPAGRRTGLVRRRLLESRRGLHRHKRAALMVGTSGALRILYETERPQPRPGLFLYRVDERRVVEGERSLTGQPSSVAGRDARGIRRTACRTRSRQARPHVPPLSRR